MRFVDQDTGESAMDVVAVPEGVSIQIGTSGSDYVSVILKPERIDDLFRLLWKLRHQNHAKPAPAPKLPSIGMLQLNNRDEAMVIHYALLGMAALLAGRGERASQAAVAVRDYTKNNPQTVVALSKRLKTLEVAAWPDGG